MKNYTKVFVLSCLLIFALNICFAQTTTDSTSAKKTVKQKKSRVFTRVEMGLPAGFNQGTPYSSASLNPGFECGVTVGYSFSKNFRVGIGADYLYYNNEYAPVMASVEFGNHTKRVNALLDINSGYAFAIPDQYASTGAAASFNGVMIEALPGISFGFNKAKSRLRLSLGNQFLSTRYAPQLFYLQNASTRVEYIPYGSYRVLRVNMLLKVGMDF